MSETISRFRRCFPQMGDENPGDSHKIRLIKDGVNAMPQGRVPEQWLSAAAETSLGMVRMVDREARQAAPAEGWVRPVDRRIQVPALLDGSPPGAGHTGNGIAPERTEVERFRTVLGRR